MDLDQKHHQQKQRLEAKLTDQYGLSKATIKAELQTVQKKLEATGVRKVLRDVFGRTRTDTTAREQLAASLRDIRQREGEQRQALEARQDQDRQKLEQRMDARHEQLRKGVEKAKARREGEGWQPYRAKKLPQKPVQPANDPPRGKSLSLRDRTSQPAPEPSERLSLDDKKRVLDVHLGDKKSLDRPWTRASLKEDRARPWERDDKPTGRERSPTSGKPKGGGGKPS